MNTDQAMMIIDIAKTHSFNKTAERLYTTQQSISYRVKQLERELNIEIFIRSKNGVTFTQNGQYVLQCAHEMVKAYSIMHEKIEHLAQDSKKKRQVVLYISSVLISSKMTSIIREFNKKCPNTRLVLKEDVDKDQMIQALLEYKCDLAFWSVNKGLFEQYCNVCEEENIQSRVVIEDDAVAVVAADSSLAGCEQLSIENMRKVPKSTFGVYPVDYFGRDINTIVLYENNNVEVHRQLVLDEHAICFTTRKIAECLFADPLLVKKSFDYPTLPIQHMVLKKSNDGNEAINVLEQIIVRAIH